MRDLITISTLLLALALCSCQSTDAVGDTGESIDLIYEAGMVPDVTWNFLPYPAHYGKLEGMPTFVLSKSTNPGSSRRVQRIATLDIEMNGKPQQWLITVDAHPNFKIDGLTTANDLMTTHSGIKSTLERWITYHQGLGNVQIRGWKSANAPN